MLGPCRSPRRPRRHGLRRSGRRACADVAVEGDRVVGVGAVPADATPRARRDRPGRHARLRQRAEPRLGRRCSVDGAGASDLLQGVTTEVFGEAFSLGPSDERSRPGAARYGDGPASRSTSTGSPTGWTTWSGAGVAPNVAASSAGTNLRVLGAGFDDRPLTAAELDRAAGVVDEEMQDGALGIGTALIYPPGRFADTDELVALCEVVGRHDGALHLAPAQRGRPVPRVPGRAASTSASAPGAASRSTTSRPPAGTTGPRWRWRSSASRRRARAGQPVTADMYPYAAGGTALAASIPPRFHDGGTAGAARPARRPGARAGDGGGAPRARRDDFENLFLAAGRRRDPVRSTTSRRHRRPRAPLSEVADELGHRRPGRRPARGRAPRTRHGVLYFIDDEANVELGLSQPWVSIGSDAAAHPAFRPSPTARAHPRTYGTFARFLGHYVPRPRAVTFADAVRRMTCLPATTLRPGDRGGLVARRLRRRRRPGPGRRSATGRRTRTRTSTP